MYPIRDSCAWAWVFFIYVRVHSYCRLTLDKARQTLADVLIETLRTLEHQMGKYAIFTVETCAYAGTGNVLKVQKLLETCTDHLEDKNSHQAVAVLGIALIAMGEEIGADMAIRSFERLLQYGEPVIRRAIPVALGLLSISNPRVGVMDTLSKLSHDADEEVAIAAILGLGLIGAGTVHAGHSLIIFQEPTIRVLLVCCAVWLNIITKIQITYL